MRFMLRLLDQIVNFVRTWVGFLLLRTVRGQYCQDWMTNHNVFLENIFLTLFIIPGRGNWGS